MDQSEFITDEAASSNHEEFYYYIGDELQAMRQGKWKVVLPHPRLEFGYVNDPYRPEPELYNLEEDIAEQHNLKDQYPEKVEELLELAEENAIEPSPDTRTYASPREEAQNN